MSRERGWVAKSPHIREPDNGTDVDSLSGVVNGWLPEFFIRRFCALFVDWILCLLVSGIFARDPLRAGLVPLIVLVVEYAFFIGLFTQTPGMFIAKIRCVSRANGGRIGVPRAFLRGLLLALLIPALLGWHDRAAGSVIQPADRPA